MSLPSALEMLIELASKASASATRQLGRCIQAGNEAKQKLALLQQYRDDYAGRLERNMQTGLSVDSYRNFQLFIEKIDQVLGGQQEVLNMAQSRISAATLAWQGCERKRLSYDTLATRAKHAAQRLASKRDQKQSDEQASRMHYYNN